MAQGQWIEDEIHGVKHRNTTATIMCTDACLERCFNEATCSVLCQTAAALIKQSKESTTQSGNRTRGTLRSFVATFINAYGEMRPKVR